MIRVKTTDLKPGDVIQHNKWKQFTVLDEPKLTEGKACSPDFKQHWDVTDVWLTVAYEWKGEWVHKGIRYDGHAIAPLVARDQPLPDSRPLTIYERG